MRQASLDEIQPKKVAKPKGRDITCPFCGAKIKRIKTHSGIIWGHPMFTKNQRCVDYVHKLNHERNY